NCVAQCTSLARLIIDRAIDLLRVRGSNHHKISLGHSGTELQTNVPETSLMCPQTNARCYLWRDHGYVSGRAENALNLLFSYHTATNNQYFVAFKLQENWVKRHNDPFIPPTHAELFPVKDRAGQPAVPLRREECATQALNGVQKTGVDFHRPGVFQDSCGAAARLRQ